MSSNNPFVDFRHKRRSKPKHWRSKPSTLLLQRWFSMRTYLKDLSFLFLSFFALFNKVNDRTYPIWLIRINLHDFQSWDLSIMNWGQWSFLFVMSFWKILSGSLTPGAISLASWFKLMGVSSMATPMNLPNNSVARAWDSAKEWLRHLYSPF